MTTRYQQDTEDRAFAPEPTYMVIRFSMTEPKEVIKEGLTLEEARAHCSREDTHGDGWFDGYDEEAK